MIILCITITVLYLALIVSFTIGFDKVKTFVLSDIQAKTRFSVVIPFRNEAYNLPKLLRSLEHLNYSKHLFEVILIDDESEDNSVALINTALNNSGLNLKIIQNDRITNAPKKDAITNAIKQAKHEWIVTTDADCILPKFWLDSFDGFIQNHNTVCITAPVTYYDEHSFLSRFQSLDFMSLQGATIGGFGVSQPFLCNGANFAYTKATFQELNGFEGNSNISSGDDIFLLEKIIIKYPKLIHYLKFEKAIVSTKPQPSWAALIEQRIRWAAKTGNYHSWFGKLTGLSVFLMNLMILILPVLSLFGFFNIKIWVYILVIKLNIDFLLLYKTSAFFNQRQVFRSFLISFFIYPFFSVYVAILSLFKGYKWKGRSFKR
ncbi:glycosyltransferase [Hyunsoonleella flava]|uniref:Glycosyltransferase n=1 Tax=Hyunsoonleella flava TaxID=2527939 RepID=A0A4Q9FFW7_9FLAO|nr:glycosyltransferase [Hyunsoonleella flava]TBN05306.1 glycosyltransferase [Hyunsoonleella flava]